MTDAIEVLRAIERALQDHPAAEVLDENSPLRDAMRTALAAHPKPAEFKWPDFMDPKQGPAVAVQSEPVWCDACSQMVSTQCPSGMCKIKKGVAPERQDPLSRTRDEHSPGLAEPIVRWKNLDAAMKDPLFQSLRGVMGTANYGQDDALFRVLSHFEAAHPKPAAPATADHSALIEELETAAARLTQRTNSPLDGLLQAAADALRAPTPEPAETALLAIDHLIAKYHAEVWAAADGEEPIDYDMAGVDTAKQLRTAIAALVGMEASKPAAPATADEAVSDEVIDAHVAVNYSGSDWSDITGEQWRNIARGFLALRSGASAQPADTERLDWVMRVYNVPGSRKAIDAAIAQEQPHDR